MPMSTIYGGITPPPDPNNPTPPTPIIVDPNKPVFVVTQEQWDRAKDAAGKFWPTLKEYWPQITIVLVGLGSLIGSGTYVATKSTEPAVVPEVKVEPKVVIDLKPVTEGLTKLDKSMVGLREDILSLSKKVDEKKDPKADPLSPIKFTGATKADVNGDPVEVKVMLGKGAKDLKVWGSPNTTSYVKVFGDTVIVRAKDSSDIFIEAACTVDGKLIDPVYWRIVAGQGPMPPPGPEPEPKPKPKPVDPAPIPVAGLRVLIVEEATQRHTLSQGQRAILLGKQFRDFLELKCVVGPDSRTKEYRIYDADISMSGESKLWQDVMKRPRSSIPWIVISNGTTGFEGPLPNSVEDAIALVNKYGASQ
jgi:hypothetical protein